MKIELLKKTASIVRSFFADDTSYYAASLSFFTIFSMLPIITLFIAILSYLPQFNQYLDSLTGYIFDMLNPTHSQEVVEALNSYISNSSKLGGLGLVYMSFVFVMFLKNYENIVNKIHEAKRKPLYASFFIYLLYIVILPSILMFLNLMNSFYSNALLNGVVLFLFAWFIFYSLFKVSINKKIHYKATLISSLITLVVLSLSKNMFVYYVAYNQTYTTIYGSLSILLFTFFWIYISWVIYLYGIKMCAWLNEKYQQPELKLEP